MIPTQLLTATGCALLLLSSAAFAEPVATTKDRVAITRPRTLFAQLEVSASLLQALGEGDRRPLSASYAGRVGYKLPRLTDFFCVLEHDLWLGSDVSTSGLAQVINWGGGLGVTLRQARVRSSLAAGASTMLFRAMNSDRLSTGLFVDVRPISLRLKTRGRTEVELVLLSFQASLPKLEGIPLIHFEFRTGLAVEVGP